MFSLNETLRILLDNQPMQDKVNYCVWLEIASDFSRKIMNQDDRKHFCERLGIEDDGWDKI